jgi:predicted small lipoprotein YifL
VTQLADISRSLRLSVAITALFVLAGCGIKGPLELPTDAQVKASDAKGQGEYPGERRLPGYGETGQSLLPRSAPEITCGTSLIAAAPSLPRT